MPTRIVLSLLSCLLLAAGCAPQPVAQPSVSKDHYFDLSLGPKAIYVQLALTRAEQSQGLMHRESLAADHGMLFVFDEPDRRGFWMRNTRIPLDIGYFDDRGRLLEVYQMYPFDETSVPSRSPNIQFALEMTQGWFAAQGIGPGTELPLDMLAEAIEARGFSPAAYGLP